MNPHRTCLALLVAVVAIGSWIGPPALAATYQWSNASGGTWEDPNNWTPRGYPRSFFDFGVFNLAGAYPVDATNAAAVQSFGILDVRNGAVRLSTHDALRAVIGVGLGATPANLTLERGAVSGASAHSIGANGTLVLAPGTRLDSRSSTLAGYTIAAGGALRGDQATLDGRIVQNAGTVSPGLAPGQAGVLAIGRTAAGGYVQRDTGTLAIELGGPAAGTEYDQLRIETASSPVTLAGTLAVGLIGSFVPGDGRFDVLTAPAITGTFATVVLPDVPRCEFAVVYEPTRVSIVTRRLAPDIVYPLDLKPAGCPNPLNPRQQGVVPAALLGADGLDVHAIDPATIRLEGVAPLRWSYEDVSAPASGEACACTDAGPDGIEDLSLKFEATALVAALSPLAQGDERPVTLTGALGDGQPFTASDCFLIVGGGGNAGGGRRIRILAEARAWEPLQQVTFDLPDPADVRLDVYNTAGRKVGALAHGPRAAGVHTVEWNAADLPNGIYYCHIAAGGRTGAAKLVLVR
jgi:hypothetical protein